MKKTILVIATSTVLNVGAQELSDLPWVRDDGTGAISTVAKIKIQQGYAYLNTSGTDGFLKYMGNPPNGASYTIAPTDLRWFGILQYDPVGYIKDDEKIDQNKLLEALKENTIKSNDARKKAGYGTLELVGWASPPVYDKTAQRLEWGTRLKDESGMVTVNMTTKILGKSGYTKVILVTSPETYKNDWVEFKSYMTNLEYNPGEKYSEWKQGDKVAAYGLGALVLGGAAAVATSKGGFKAIALLVIGGIAALWAAVKKFFGGK